MTSSTLQVSGGQNQSDHRYSEYSHVLDVPNLISVQLDSFDWFKGLGLKALFDDISPIEDLPGGRFELRFLGHTFGEPVDSEDECRETETTFSAPLYVTVELLTKAPGPVEGERKQQELFIGDGLTR